MNYELTDSLTCAAVGGIPCFPNSLTTDYANPKDSPKESFEPLERHPFGADY